MKRVFIAAIAMLAFSMPAAAQMRSGPPKSGEGMFTGITLTAAQQKQVDSLYAANQPERDKMKAQMQSGQKPDSAQMSSMRAMRDKSMGNYRGILTSDQQKVFDKNIADMKAKMGGMEAPAAGSTGMAPKQ